MRDILWIDVETTGLNPDKHSITEIAAVLTDPKGEYIDTAHFVLPRDELQWQDEAMQMAMESGLLKQEPNCESPYDVIRKLWDISCECEKRPRLGGVGPHFDRAFLRSFFKHVSMEDVDKLLHYQNVDMRTTMDMMNMMSVPPPEGYDTWEHRRGHRAMPDVTETIHLYQHALNVLQDYTAFARHFDDTFFTEWVTFYMDHPMASNGVSARPDVDVERPEVDMRVNGKPVETKPTGGLSGHQPTESKECEPPRITSVVHKPDYDDGVPYDDGGDPIPPNLKTLRPIPPKRSTPDRDGDPVPPGPDDMLHNTDEN